MQESKNYKTLVRQHVDIESIQAKIEQGCYSSCTLSFYKDLLLLFNNAIVFFPKPSLESITAHELRTLVSNQMKKETQKSESFSAAPAPSSPITAQLKPELERSDSLLARQQSSAPLIVCRKRSSISTKPSSSSGFGSKGDQQQSDEGKPASGKKLQAADLSLKEKEKPVTGTRSSRRSSSSKNTVTANPNKKQSTTNSGSKQESPKTEKKKTEALMGSDKKKSVVDFLKRIKKNSPADQTTKKGGNNKGGGEQKKNTGNNSNNNNNGKKEKGKERVLRSNGEKKKGKEEGSPSKRNVGRPPKKEAETTNAETLGKRGRESGGGKEKQQRKRSRR